MTINVKHIKESKINEPMVMFPLRQYDELMDYLEDMEDRLAAPGSRWVLREPSECPSQPIALRSSSYGLGPAVPVPHWPSWSTRRTQSAPEPDRTAVDTLWLARVPQSC